MEDIPLIVKKRTLSVIPEEIIKEDKEMEELLASVSESSDEEVMDLDADNVPDIQPKDELKEEYVHSDESESESCNSVVVHDEVIDPAFEATLDAPEPVTLDECAHDIGDLANQVALLQQQVDMLKQHLAVHLGGSMPADKWAKCERQVVCKCSTCREIKLYGGFTLKQLRAFGSTFGFTC